MSDKTKVKLAFAEAIILQLWVKGLITDKQREIVDKQSRETFEQENC